MSSTLAAIFSNIEFLEAANSLQSANYIRLYKVHVCVGPVIFSNIGTTKYGILYVNCLLAAYRLRVITGNAHYGVCCVHN